MKRLLVPPVAWLAAFLLVPAAILTASAFSAEGWRHLADPVTLGLLGRSFRIALIATAFCLLLGYPAAAFIAGCAPRWRNVLLFLVVLPFWTNLLVRTVAQMSLLRAIDPELLYTEAAVIIGLVHGYLPFMILPLYASIEKVPRRLLEASQDLGASPWETFRRVTLPLTAPGIAAGCILVFIPVLGAFATPELMGGARGAMIGNHINTCFMKARNVDAGSPITLLLMLVTLALTGAHFRLKKSEGLV